jgi:polar amino acid transport system substrate-binding protein
MTDDRTPQPDDLDPEAAGEAAEEAAGEAAGEGAGEAGAESTGATPDAPLEDETLVAGVPPVAAAGAAGAAGAASGAAAADGSPPPPPPPSGTNPWIIAGAVAGGVALIVVIWLVFFGGDDGEEDDPLAGGTTTTEAAGETTTTASEATTTAGETTTTVGETTTTAGETTTTAAETTTTVAETTTTAASGIGGECAIDQLNLLEDGVLTVATGEPAFPPWVGTADEFFDEPESQTGFESAVVYNVASTLGFAADDVTWVRTGFDEAIAPGDKDFDFNIQQYTITDERDQAVDFSDPYYVTAQSLVSLPDSSVVGATTLADLVDANLGAAIGTTSLDFIDNVIQPNNPASVYDDNVDAITALIAGQVDGIIVDLPTAYFITAVQIPEQGGEGVIVAQFETPAQDPDEFGMLFADGNPLVDCVNQALTILRDDGTLEALEDQWLTSDGNIATITG